MGVWLYDFNGADTADGTGIPVPAGYPVLQQIDGSWRRLNNRAYTSTSRESDPMLVLTDGVGNADISANVSPYGGDCLYARVSDADNWLRLRVRRWQTSYNYTYYVTEYEWASVSKEYHYLWGLTYFHDWDARQHGGAAPSYSSFEYKQWLTNVINSYSAANYFPEYVYGKLHEHSDGFYHEHRYRGYPSGPNMTLWDSYTTNEVDYYYWTTSTSTSDPDDYRTGSTRQSPRSGTAYQTHYALYLEKCVNGVVYQLGSAQVGAPSSLRLRVEDSNIEAYYNGNGSPVLSTTDAFNATVASHGIGRGESEYTGTALDNLSVDTLNTPSNSPGIIAPAEGSSVSSATALTFEWLFSDPDPGDSQSAFDLDYRVVGASTWTRVTESVADGFYVLPGDTLEVATDYEWRVRTYDTAGEPGPWSPVMHFTTLAYGSVVVAGQIKPVNAMSVIVGGVRKTVTAVSVIVNEAKKTVG